MTNQHKKNIKKYGQIIILLLIITFSWMFIRECGSIEKIFPRKGFPRTNIDGVITVSRIAPDGSLRALLLDICFLGIKPLDRNFSVGIQRNGETTVQIFFVSNDEGDPDNDDIIWSKDSSRFILVGKKLSSNYEIDKLPSNDPLRNTQNSGNFYLIYEVSSGKIWFNGYKQRLPDRELPRFSLEDVKKYEWVSKF